MKKVFFILILLLPINIMAKGYTEYGPYQYSDKEVFESDLVEVLKEDRYKFYYKRKVYSNSYYMIGKNSSLFPYRSSKKKYGEYSNYSITKPKNINGRKIEEKVVLKYQPLKKVRYIKISNLVYSKFYMHVGDINVYYNNEKINYTYTTNYEVIENIHDNFGFVKVGDGVLIFDLKDYYDVAGLKVIFSGKSADYNDSFSYDIELNYDDSFENTYIKETRYVKYNKDLEFLVYYYVANDIFTVTSNAIKNYIYEDALVDSIDLDKESLYRSKKITYYRYKDTYYKYYRIERVYLNGYFTNMKGYIKDKNKSKTIYKYRIRNYIKNTESTLKNESYRHREMYIILPALIIIFWLFYKKRRKDALN